MKFKTFLKHSMLIASLSASVAMAADNFSAGQKEEIQKIVHEYLINNPQVLVEVSQALQQKQQQAMQQQAQSAIGKNAKQLFTDKLTVVGNLKGDVTLVEFFDYQCIHCKHMAPIISETMGANKNLRVVFKEFPIFGKSSDNASRAALAAGMQGKYLAMHDALFKQAKRLNDKIIEDTAKSLNLNLDKLKADMQSKEVTAELEANRQLAEKLHLLGTPAFIIASTPAGKFQADTVPAFVPGAITKEALQGLIDKANGKK